MNHRGTETQSRSVGSPCPTLRAFTVVELLVVIAVIILLAALITGAATAMFRQQKQATTRSVMNNIVLAIEQFQQADPLRNVYNLRDRATFGSLPPMMLSDHDVNGSVSYLMDREVNGPNDPSPPYLIPQNYSLSGRLHRDIGESNGNRALWVDINEPDERNHDIRGLYAYLTVFADKAMSQIPDAYKKPLSPNRPEYVNPKGTGTAPASAGKIDVLGFVDAWGVPLDYTVYVKLEWSPPRPGSNDPPEGRFRIADRRPAIRSRGIEREKYDAGQTDPSKELWSDDLPRPYAALSNVNTGELDTSAGSGQTRGNGWLRLPGDGDGPSDSGGYKYRPN